MYLAQRSRRGRLNIECAFKDVTSANFNPMRGEVGKTGEWNKQVVKDHLNKKIGKTEFGRRYEEEFGMYRDSKCVCYVYELADLERGVCALAHTLSLSLPPPFAHHVLPLFVCFISLCSTMIFSFLRYDGSTALIIASHFDFEDIAIALLRAGADDAILDKLENTAAEVWFEESGNGKIDEWAAMKNQAVAMLRDGVDGTEGDIGFDKTR